MDIIDELRTYKVETETASWHPSICEKAADYIAALLDRMESMEAEKQKLCEEADHLKDLLKEAESDRDAAVKDLRQMCVGGNTCAFCAQDRKCGKAGPGRKTVGTCWEWRGPQAGC